MIYISQDLYLSAPITADLVNRPLVGYKSVLRPLDFSVQFDGPVVGPDPSIMWSPDTYSFFARSFSDTAPGGASTFIDMANPGSEPVDYIGIARHNFGTRGYAVSVEHSFDGSEWVASTNPAIPPNNKSIFIVFVEQTAPFWRLRISYTTGGSAQIIQYQIAHIKLGKAIRFARPRYVGEIPSGMDYQVEMIRSKSDSGQIVSSVLTSSHLPYNITQNHTDPQFVRQTINPFLRHCQLLEPTAGNGPRGTFFYAWRPEDYPNELMYCDTPTSVSNPSNQLSNGLMEFSLSGTGVE
jgi:hypothetical protein